MAEQTVCAWCKRPCSLIEYKEQIVPACDKLCAQDAFVTYPKIEAIMTRNFDKMKELGIYESPFDTHFVADLQAKQRERQERLLTELEQQLEEVEFL